MDEKPKKDYLLPASILVAALLVSISLIYNTGKKTVFVEEDKLAGAIAETAETPSFSKVQAVNKNDHLLGNSNASVKIVEFSDLECPFCKRFHSTMKQVVETYGDKVAWVYRHFPLDSLHSKARKEAEATECATELGGDKAFWTYTDKLFELTPSNNGLDLALLPKIATDIGLDKIKFETCLSSGKYAEKIAQSIEDAIASGGQGTPYSIVIKNGKAEGVIPGALPFEQVRAILDGVLK